MCSSKGNSSFLIDDILKKDKKRPAASKEPPIFPSPQQLHRTESVWGSGSHTGSSFYEQRRFPVISPYFNHPHMSGPARFVPYHQHTPNTGLGHHNFDLNAYNYLSNYLNFMPGMVKRKGGQVRFTANQTNALETRFTKNKYLSPEDRRLLASQLKLTDRQVKTWFQNRRAKWRRSSSDGTAAGARNDAERVTESDPDSKDSCDVINSDHNTQHV